MTDPLGLIGSTGRAGPLRPDAGAGRPDDPNKPSFKDALLRNLDIADTRDKLRIYGDAGLLGDTKAGGVPLLGPERKKK